MSHGNLDDCIEGGGREARRSIVSPASSFSPTTSLAPRFAARRGILDRAGCRGEGGCCGKTISRSARSPVTAATESYASDPASPPR